MVIISGKNTINNYFKQLMIIFIENESKNFFLHK
jgi:hypothetical protein